MAHDDASSIQTRPSLLKRLATGDDTEGWQEFYRVYGKLVRDFAIHASLTDTEADEVVQEIAIAMAQHLQDFHYDPKVCRFKTWLLNQASWRIKDQLKKRRRESVRAGNPEPAASGDDTARSATINRVADPAAVDLDSLFETEWRKNLFAVALDRVREQFSLKQFQVFDLLVLKEWSAREVAKSLGVSLANVYVTKHRVAAAVKKEMTRLERELNKGDKRSSPPT